MKRIVGVIALAIATALGALTLGPAASAKPLPVVYNGFTSWAHPTVTPRFIYVRVMSDTIGPDTWSRWNSNYAKGRGWQTTNNCIPYCARGHITWYRVWITLSQVKHHGRTSYFSRMAVVRANGTKTQIYHYSKAGMSWSWH